MANTTDIETEDQRHVATVRFSHRQDKDDIAQFLAGTPELARQRNRLMESLTVLVKKVREINGDLPGFYKALLAEHLAPYLRDADEAVANVIRAISEGQSP